MFEMISIVLLGEATLSAAWQQVAAWPAVVAVAALVILLAAAWGIHWFWQSRQKATQHCPRRLLKQLYIAHRLRWHDKWLIGRLVKQHALQHPALVFLEPSLSDPTNLGAFGRRHQAQLARLQRQIFAAD